MAAPAGVEELRQLQGVRHGMMRHGVLTRLPGQAGAQWSICNQLSHLTGQLLGRAVAVHADLPLREQSIRIDMQADDRYLTHPGLNERVGKTLIAAGVDEDMRPRE